MDHAWRVDMSVGPRARILHGVVTPAKPKAPRREPVRAGTVNSNGFLPTSRAEMSARGWDLLDVLIITGDAYVDHPSFGAAVIGRVLEAEGYRVGIVAQPDWRRAEAIEVMGRPRLFCGVTAGNLDSMLANYTAARHRRREDCYSEYGVPGRRPNHAAVIYAQMCRRSFPGDRKSVV